MKLNFWSSSGNRRPNGNTLKISSCCFLFTFSSGIWKKILTEIFKIFIQVGHISFCLLTQIIEPFFVDFSEQLLFSECFPGKCLNRNMHESAVPILQYTCYLDLSWPVLLASNLTLLYEVWSIGEFQRTSVDFG